MRTLRLTIPLCCAFFTANAGAAPAPEAAVNAFLSFYFGKYRLGVPPREQLPEMAPFVTPALLAALDGAAAAEACHVARVGNEEPPLAEGDIFSSLFEGAKSATLAPAEITGDRAVVTVHWTYDDPADGSPPTKWDDRVFLEQVAGDWRIADVAHDGDWQFMSKARLTATLASIATACQ